MKTGDERSKQAAELRLQAEEIAREKAFQIPDNMESLSIEAARQLLHELRVHQIELEMQNDELRRAQEELVAARALYFDLYDLAPVGYFTLSEAGLILEANLTAVTLMGVTRSALAKQPLSNFIIKEDQDVFYRLRKQVLEAASALEKGAVVEAMTCDLRMARNGGMFFWGHITMTVASNVEGANVYRVVLVDITERMQAEEALQESEANYRQLFDTSPSGIYRVDFRTGKFLKANDVICKYLNCSQEEITSHSPYDVLTDDSKQLLLERLREMGLGEKVMSDPEYQILDQNGRYRWLHLNSKNIYDEQGLLVGADVVAHDITDRKQAEEELRKSEEEFRSLAESMPQIVWATRKDGWNIYFNQQWVDYTGLTLEESYGHGWNIPFHPDDRQRAWEAWENATKNNGSYSLECRLRRADGVYRWYLVRGVPLIDETGEIIKWFGTCTDIDNIKRAEKQLKDVLESLRKSFGATVQVLVSAVEARDPYTSGHQMRSADLARAIAMEMGLPQDKIEGIRMAGSIHDIGKLSIPAEILSKPTKLSDIEFGLITEHASRGYEILKEVESAWPLAQIVYQHHERMDGSGYPRNLKGEEILIEARILAVADTVEAMASHRPYRPGLGIDAALNEIEKNSGIFYDNAVADACLRLFREKGFKLEGIANNQ